MENKLYYDLSGGIDNSAAKMVSENSKKVHWLDSQNIEIYKNTGIRRMKGNSALLDTPLGEKIISLGEYVKADKHYLVCFTDAGKFYLYNSATSSFILKKSGLDATKQMAFVSYCNGLICSNGVDEPFFFEYGAEEEIKSCNALSALGTSIRGTAIAVFKGRAWIADSSTLYFSALGRFDDWSTADDAGFISNFHNDSSKITSLKNYNDYLAIYKEDKTYLLTGTRPDDFAITLFADRGCISFNGTANVQNKQFFFDNAVFALEMSGELQQINLSSDLSKSIKNEFENLDLTRLKEVCVLPYSRKNQVWFFLPYSGKLYLNTVWIFDFYVSAWFKRIVPQNITCACTLDGLIVTADSNGQIYLEDNSTSFSGIPIEFYWQSYYFTFGNPNIAKTVDEFYLSLDETFNNSFTFSVFKDFSSFSESDIQVFESQASLGLIWDEGYWAGDEIQSIWAPDNERFEKVVLSGANRGVSIKIHGDTVKDDFALLGLEFRDIYVEA